MTGAAQAVDADVRHPAADVFVGPALHRPGPISRFVDQVERLGWRGWLVYLGLGVALVAWSHGLLWLSGRLPVGQVDTTFAPAMVYGPYALIGLAIARRIARRSVATFWPATGWPDREQPIWIAAFDDIPARFEGVCLLFGLLIAGAALAATPTTVVGPEQGRTLTYVAIAPSYLAGYGLATVVIANGIRWMLLVVRIHRHAQALDPFDPAPIYAFSRLTVWIGLFIVAATYYSFTVNAGVQAGNLPSLVFGATTTVLGIIAFVAPLWGIHGRLVHLKEQLLLDVERRITVAGAEMYTRVDAGLFDQTKAVTDSITGLVALRDRVVRLPTWPWHPQLFRGFVSALLLPIIVYVLSQAIGGSFRL